jgi:uncharacterized protein YjbI with pentapeptide repeats
MNTLSNFFNPLHNQDASYGAQYEIIENENVKSMTYNNLTLSGSLFSMSTFTDVTFDSCEFYGTKWENCQFIRCKFINCTFKFTHILHCNFQSSDFVSCNWHTSPLQKSQFNDCKLGTKTLYFARKESCKIENLNTKDKTLTMNWSDVLPMLRNSQDESELPPAIPMAAA